MNRHEAIAAWQQMGPVLAAKGMILPGCTMLVPDEWKTEERSIASMAMDAAGTLSTDPNSSIPTMLTTAIDPDVIRIVFSPLQMAEIMGGERKVGDWLQEQRIFPVVEDTGEVSSYSDYSTNGRAGINFNYPWFQSYLFQSILQYGEREIERAGLMRINYVSDLNKSCSALLNRFTNLTYAFGVAGLQNYGLINNPFLSSYITPALKSWGGTSWFNNGSPAATANEVYNDILALIERLVNQGNGTIDQNSKMVLAMGPQSSVALGFANSFGVFVKDLLKQGYPNLEVRTAVQYSAKSSTNQQGYSSAGNLMQLIAVEVEGQQTAYPAYNEKLRAHKIVPEMSAWKQKMTSGTWGTILRMPMAVTGMIGI